MAKLSQKELEDMAQKRKFADECKVTNKLKIDKNKETGDMPQSKIINDIMGDHNTQLYKYELPDIRISKINSNAIPEVNPEEYPSINIIGNARRNRQAKPIKFYLLKEIDFILEEVSSGKNKTAILNFLVWVGLQTLRGMSKPIDIRFHDETYADGEPVKSFMEVEDQPEN